MIRARGAIVKVAHGARFLSTGAPASGSATTSAAASVATPKTEVPKQGSRFLRRARFAVLLAGISATPFALGKIFEENERIRNKVNSIGPGGSDAVRTCLNAYWLYKDNLAPSVETVTWSLRDVMRPPTIPLPKDIVKEQDIPVHLESSASVLAAAEAVAASITAPVQHAEPDLAKALEAERQHSAELQARLEEALRQKSALESTMGREELLKTLSKEAAAVRDTELKLAAQQAASAEERLWRERVELIRNEHSRNLRDMSEQQQKQYEEELRKKLGDLETQLKRQAQLNTRSALHSQSEDFNKERVLRMGDVMEMGRQVEVFRKVLEDTTEYQKRSHDTHRVVLASQSLGTSLEQSQPLAPPLGFLRKALATNELVDVAVNSIDDSAAVQGVATKVQLIERFPKVLSRARQAAFVPEDSGIWGEVVAYLTNILTIRRFNTASAEAASSGSADQVLAWAEKCVAAGKFDEAVLTLERLEGQPRLIVRDWVNEARKRAVAEQAALALQAETTVIAASLS